MNIKVKQPYVEEAMSTLMRSIDKRANMEILRCVHIIAKDNRVTFAVYNMETGVYASETIEATIEKEGQVVVLASTLNDLVKLLSPESMQLKELKGKLSIKCGNDKSTTKTFDPDDFPPAPDTTAGYTMTMTAALFKKIMQPAVISTAKEDNRPVLCGVAMFNHAGCLYMAGADGYRLALRETFFDGPDQTYIIPRQAIEVFLGGLYDDGDVGISASKDYVEFRHGNMRVTTLLINGKYPDVMAIDQTARSKKMTIRFPKDKMLRCLKRAGVFSKDSANRIVIRAKDMPSYPHKKLDITIEGQSVERGDSVDEMEVDAEGSAHLNITVNINYLLDAIKNTPTEMVMMDYQDSTSPVVIRPEDPHGTRHIIMPMGNY